MGLLPGWDEEAAKEKEGERLRLPGRLLMAGNHVIGWDTTAPGVTVLSFMTSSLGWIPAQCLVPGINTSWQQPSPRVFLPHIPVHRPTGQLLLSKEPMEISIPALLIYCPEPFRWSTEPRFKPIFLPFSLSQATWFLQPRHPWSAPSSYPAGSHHGGTPLRI